MLKLKYGLNLHSALEGKLKKETKSCVCFVATFYGMYYCTTFKGNGMYMYTDVAMLLFCTFWSKRYCFYNDMLLHVNFSQT